MAKTLPMSRFIQHYNQHLTEAERADDVLLLSQRSGRPTWVLETEDRARATTEATEYVAGALAALAGDETLTARFADALVTALPWTRFLPKPDRDKFVTDAAETLRACASLGRYTAFADLVAEWRATADIWSDPELAETLSRDISDPLDVPVNGPRVSDAST